MGSYDMNLTELFAEADRRLRAREAAVRAARRAEGNAKRNPMPCGAPTKTGEPCQRRAWACGRCPTHRGR